MHDLRGNFFIDGRRRRGKERRKGEGKHRNEEGRGGKGGGEIEGERTGREDAPKQRAHARKTRKAHK